jgi:hypothetical protein
MHLPDQVSTSVTLFGTKASRYDHFAIDSQGFPDGIQAFLDSVINKAAGVDDDQVGVMESLGSLVTLGIELRQNQL